MSYLDLSERLKSLVAYEPDEIDLGEGLILSNHEFKSRSTAAPSIGPERAVPEALREALPEVDLSSLFVTPDDEIAENALFRYHVMRLKKSPKAEAAIILLHGFNERHWDKYLPMAENLVRTTGRAVFLFPIAFHMNRSPSLWHNSRLMGKVSHYRKKSFPDVIQSTLSNAAISVRLHADPSRFFWSGLQSYEDVVSLAADIKAGRHPAVGSGASVNFFTYSIGTLLGEIIMMTDQHSLFSDSKFVTFCGGPVFNRLSPVSKFILDSEANVRLYSFLVEHLDSHRRHDPRLESFLGETEVGRNFRALLNYRLEVDYREDKLRSLSSRIMAVALAKDEVVPPFEVVNTLQGSKRDIPIKVEVVDFPYPYRHEDPFPPSPKYSREVDGWFNKLFAGFGDFLK